MTHDPNNKRRAGRAKRAAVMILMLIGIVISRMESCDCNNAPEPDSSNDSLLADFDYEFNVDDFDFSVFEDDYEFAYEFEEEQLHLRVNQAVFDMNTGILTAVIENYGNSSEDGLPAIIMNAIKDSEDYICCVYPESYYKEAEDKFGYSIEYRTLILPQTEVTLTYQLQSYELEYLKEAIAESDEIWVTFYKDTAEETYCLLEIE
ncbi:MAG: hypothetical protein IJ512_00265 [Ruminococcus sp.]|nr:hypothetical protein [Ruminococcus sp.]